jgi:hypothetical protein
MTTPDEAVKEALERGEVVREATVYQQQEVWHRRIQAAEGRAKVAEMVLREAEKLAQRIVDENDVPEMYGAGQRRAAERILSVLKHGRTS